MSDKKLISLETFNETRAEQHAYLRAMIDKKFLNGIGCPKCGMELYDSNPGIQLTSWPPKRNVACSECDYTGYRID